MGKDHHVFSIAPLEMVRDRRLTGTLYRVLLALLSFRSNNGNLVWPSRKRLSEMTEYTPQNVSRYTRQLEKLGWLRKVGGGYRGRTIQYELTVPDLAEVAAQAEAERVSKDDTLTDPERVSDPDTKRVSDPDTKRVSGSDTPYTINEQTIEPTREETSAVAPAPAPAPEKKRRPRKAKTTRPKKLATELPHEQLPEKWRGFCEEARPDLDPGWAWDQFCDHWASLPRSKALKRDWDATWRKWVRGERGLRRSPQQVRAQQVVDINTALREEYGCGDNVIEGECNVIDMQKAKGRIID